MIIKPAISDETKIAAKLAIQMWKSPAIDELKKSCWLYVRIGQKNKAVQSLRATVNWLMKIA